MVKNNKAYTLAKYAIMMATIFAAMLIDRSISMAMPISMAICVLLATFSFGFVENKWTDCFAAFTCFGLASFIKAFIFPDAVIWYYKPLVYVLPRMLAGVFCASAYKLMQMAVRKMKSRRAAQTIAMTVAIAVGLVCNTAFFLYPYSQLVAEQGFFQVVKALVTINILPEYLASLILAPMITIGVRKGRGLGLEGIPAEAA